MVYYRILNIQWKVFCIKNLYKLQEVFLDMFEGHWDFLSAILFYSFWYCIIETNEGKWFPLPQILVIVKMSV